MAIIELLVSEKSPKEKMTIEVKAVNYDARYYGNDKDFINGVIGEDGYGRRGGYHPDLGNEFPVPGMTGIQATIVTGFFSSGPWTMTGVFKGADVQPGQFGGGEFSEFELTPTVFVKAALYFYDENLEDYSFQVMASDQPSPNATVIPPADSIQSVSFVDNGSIQRTFLMSEAIASVVTQFMSDGGPLNMRCWTWPAPGAVFGFDVSTSYLLTFVV